MPRLTIGELEVPRPPLPWRSHPLGPLILLLPGIVILEGVSPSDRRGRRVGRLGVQGEAGELGTRFRDEAILEGVRPSVLGPIADAEDPLVVPAVQVRVQDLENVQHF